MSIDVNQFFQVFFDESEELLSDMESLLLSINVDTPDSEECNAIFRTAHSIKGGAATFGLSDMTEVTHVMESLLDKIRKGEMPLTTAHVDAFLQAKDVLRMQLEGHRHKHPVDRETSADVMMLLQALSDVEITKMQPSASFAVHDEVSMELNSAADAAKKYVYRFRIELPKTPDDDINSLAEELGLMGAVTRDVLPDGRAVFTLDTDEKSEVILAVAAFVLDPDELVISDMAGANAAKAALPAEDRIVGTAQASNADNSCGALSQEMKKYAINLPKIPDEALEGLINELGMLGKVLRERDTDGCPVLNIETSESKDDVLAICSFAVDDVAHVGVKEIQGASTPLAEAAKKELDKIEGFGLFEPLKVEPPKKDDGFEIFEPMEKPEAGADCTEDEHDDHDEDELEKHVSSVIAAATRPAPKAQKEKLPPASSAVEKPVAAKPPAETKPASVAAKAAADAKPDAANKSVSAKQAAAKEAPARGGASANANPESTSIRVNLDKVDQLINLVGELVITQAMIAQHAGGLDQTVHERMTNSLATLARNTRDLQEAVMSIRMMPMDFVFSRFPRMVRDLAGKLNKKVELISKGGATELDKGLIERIVDPLTHLVRNSIDHGIEPPPIRIASGKPETGRLILSAAHVSGNIVVEVADDGGGLNRDRILKKARESGLPVSDDMRDDDVWQLIFAPGFSTADVVSDVSGRGVGMDVVKRNILSMGGSVEIRSVRGQGTTIVISLPLTLAILEGMSIRSGDEVYILPLSSVVESLKPSADNIRDVSGQGQVLRVRDEYLPLVFLHELFSIQPQCNSLSDGIAVVLEADGKKVALFVDGLVGQQQVVVKNLESNYRKTRGISGATILGDGSVSLILDISSLLHVGGQITRNYERSITMH